MRIYVYGTGRYATNFLNYAKELTDQIAGFIETKKSKNMFKGKPVYIPSEVSAYDLIIVASQFVYEIKEALYRNNFDFEKVVFLAKEWIPAEICDSGINYYFEKASDRPTDEAVFFELNSIYTTSSDIAEKIKGNITPESFWEGVTEYLTDIHVPHIAAVQRDMLDKSFIPRLEKDDVVCDVGCASGEWSRYISPYVKEINGYDVSESLINTAMKRSEEYGFNNTEFSCINALDIGFYTQYDHGLLLGISTYFNNNELKNLIENISKSIKNRGYLAVRDTISMYMDLPIYIVRNEKGSFFNQYSGIYHPMKIYEQLFEDNGFRVVEERYFCSYFHEPMELGVHGYIFEKI